MLWTNKQFWLDTTWRSFRTFCQTLAGLLAAQFSGLLQAAGQSTITPHAPWSAFLYASGVAALISLLQSVDRERAVGATLATTPPTVVEVPLLPPPVPAVTPIGTEHEVSVSCGDVAK